MSIKLGHEIYSKGTTEYVRQECPSLVTNFRTSTTFKHFGSPIMSGLQTNELK